MLSHNHCSSFMTVLITRGYVCGVQCTLFITDKAIVSHCAAVWSNANTECRWRSFFFPSDSHFHGSWPIRSEPKLHFKSFHLAHDFQTRSEPWDCQGWVGYPLSEDYRHCCRLLVPVSPPHQSLSFTSFIRAIATIERIVLKETSDTLTVYSKRQDSCQ